ncbi:MAG TPA: hypothetical protein PKO42_01740 [Tenuifilaceae bacterium]|nr:hypothetical protein [Tenuifilaceae bacterium]
MKFIFQLLIFLILSFGAAADTLTVMHYNLMYYDREYEECTAANNNVDSKDEYLRTIIGYARPDILTVNEVNASVSSVERIRTNVLNINGITKYKRANFSGSFLANMIYFNSEKVELKSQDVIPTSPRETNVYKLYLKTSSLVQGDTIFLYCMITHLKAGSDPSDEDDRTAASAAIMSYLASSNLNGNVLLMGDMNLYSAEEGAFVNFTTPTGINQFRFYDPLSMVGDWHNNHSYRNIHTQSTHTTSDGCHSTGGMDDRFDFILSSSSLTTGNDGLKITSYKTIAQDGNRFNESLINPANYSVPTDVLSALYNNSDHLPLKMSLYSDFSLHSATKSNLVPKLVFNNPANNKLHVHVPEGISIVTLNLYSITGGKMLSYQGAEPVVDMDISGLSLGIYIAEATLSDGSVSFLKVLKIR